MNVKMNVQLIEHIENNSLLIQLIMNVYHNVHNLNMLMEIFVYYHVHKLINMELRIRHV